LKKNHPIRPEALLAVAPRSNVLRVGQFRPFSLIEQDEIVARAFPFPEIEMHSDEGSPSGLRYLYPVV
jgi:hypothetical protein